MSKTKNLMAKLKKLEGAVAEEANPFLHVIRTPSPSLNFTFGNTHGLPLGNTIVLYGPPAGGKSIIANAMIGQMHKDFEDGVAIKFNTEMREASQLTPKMKRLWGIDEDRYVAYDVNHPEMIFDRITNEVAAMCQEGLAVKMIVIDSINAIQGRRGTNADTIMTQQIGDLAMTLQEGWKWILPVQRKHNIAVVLTSHIRAEMDQTEQMRGNKVKMAASFGTQHYAEYFMMVEQNRSKAGKETLTGEKLEDENTTDLMDKAEVTGHKIRVCMKKSSLGPKLRTGEFTLDYERGIINVHEEVFLLGVNRNIIEKPNNLSFEFGGKRWAGKPAMLNALKEDPDLQKAILTELMRRDQAGNYAAADKAEAEREAAEEAARQAREK